MEETMPMNEERDIVARIVECADKSEKFYKDENERKREDRRVYSACKFYTTDDRKARGENRMEEVINPLSLYHNAINNLFLSSPYVAEVDCPEGVDPEQKKFLGGALMDVLNNSDANNSIFASGLSDGEITGCGYIYLTTDNGQIQLNYATDPTSVRFDPNSKDVDGRDARFACLVDQISYEAAKERWPEIPDKGFLKNTKTYSFAGFASTPDNINLVSFFEKVDGNVEFYQVIADHVVNHITFNGLSSIPCVPVYGQQFWDGEKRLYKGIVRDVKSLVKAVNYCYSILMERVSVTTVPYDYVSGEAIEGYSADYSEGNTNNYNYRRYNAFTKLGENWQKVDPPIHISPTVSTGDILPIIDNSLAKIAKIIGVPEEGVGFVNSQTQQTATEVLARNSAMVSNVSHFYRHLKQSIKHICEIIVEILCYYNGIDNRFYVKVSQGPEITLDKERNRQQLVAIQSMIPDAAKPLITAEIVKTMNIENAQGLASAILLTLPADMQKAVVGESPMNLAQQNAQLQQQLAQAQSQVAELQKAVDGDVVANQAQILLARENNVAALRSKLVEIEHASAEHDKDLALKYAELDLDKQKAFADIMEQQKAADAKAREVALKELAEAVKLRDEAMAKRAEIVQAMQPPTVAVVE